MTMLYSVLLLIISLSSCYAEGEVTFFMEEDHQRVVLHVSQLNVSDLKTSDGVCCVNKTSGGCDDEKCLMNIIIIFNNITLLNTTASKEKNASSFKGPGMLVYYGKHDGKDDKYKDLFKSPADIKMIVNNNEDGKNIASITLFNGSTVAGNDYSSCPSGGGVSFCFYVSYQCTGYAGYNCQTKCKENSTSGLGCDYETGEQFCENNASNPPDCNISYPMAGNSSECSGHGNSTHTSRLSQSCTCDQGYEGSKCQHTHCGSPCQNNGYCVGPETCKCPIGYGGKHCEEHGCEHNFTCQNEGVCNSTEDKLYCSCDTRKYGGLFCEVKCPNECNNGFCYDHKGVGMCSCYSGFEGSTCNEIAALERSRASTEKSMNIQQIVIPVLIALVGIVVIAITCYFLFFRKNKSG